MFEMVLIGVFREDTESGDGETRDSFSDSLSDDSGSDKLWRYDGCSSEEGRSEQDNPWPSNGILGRPYFQHFERSTPYGRVPLMDKVSVFFFWLLCKSYRLQLFNLTFSISFRVLFSFINPIFF